MKALIPLFLLSASVLFAEEPTHVYYPAAPENTSSVAVAGPSSTGTAFVYILFLAAIAYAAYVFWKRKKGLSGVKNAAQAPLEVVNTRALGNRQFLVVVKYREKELLLGVGQGFITRLDQTREEFVCEE